MADWKFKKLIDSGDLFLFVCTSNRGDVRSGARLLDKPTPFRYVLEGSVRHIDIDGNILGTFSPGEEVQRVDVSEGISILVTLEDNTKVLHAIDPKARRTIAGSVITSDQTIELKENDRLIVISGVVSVDGRELDFRRPYRISSDRSSDVHVELDGVLVVLRSEAP